VRPANVNTKEYWDLRFGSGDWEERLGREQTRLFALAQVSRVGIDAAFAGVLVDFGCGLGDAMLVYRQAFPQAKLVGIDFSEAAIEKAQSSFGSIASFLHGDHSKVPTADIIVSSNVFEHLSNPLEIARDLAARCRKLVVAVPFREHIDPGTEHINSYDVFSFAEIGNREYEVYNVPGWSEGSIELWRDVYLKNIGRLFLGRRLRRRRRQIVFRISRS